MPALILSQFNEWINEAVAVCLRERVWPEYALITSDYDDKFETARYGWNSLQSCEQRQLIQAVRELVAVLS